VLMYLSILSIWLLD